ncbi:MAG: CbiX/SirB N-terminal domain-containing protein [Pseudohongiella sp.]|nr:CbiX/SirB N-terminal domain-containing protein [Pseudohongiella sp.]
MQIVRGISLASLFLLVGAFGKAHAQTSNHEHTPNHSQSPTRTGVLIMAHGGNPEWDAGVRETLEPLMQKYPLEVAFGMADAYSLQEAVSKLEHQGVTEIAVVRLFISGESWYERTRQILGLQAGAPVREVPADDHSAHGQHGSHGAPSDANHTMHRMEFWRLDTRANFSMSTEGLADAEGMSEVLLSRALALSRNPAQEDVLILAHGPEDDGENDRWLSAIGERTNLLRQGGFNQIRVATLREDWPEKREAAQKQVRDFIAESRAAGRTPVVIPYRVHGFGPYAQVLDGLDYVSDGKGLIPHPAVTRWIEDQIAELGVTP